MTSKFVLQQFGAWHTLSICSRLVYAGWHSCHMVVYYILSFPRIFYPVRLLRFAPTQFILISVPQGQQPYKESFVTEKNDCNSFRVVSRYFAFRILLAFMIRTKAVFKHSLPTDGIDGTVKGYLRRALYPGNGYPVGLPPD